MQLLGHVLALYAALGIGCVGFGVLFGGRNGGATVARFFFVRPLHWLGHSTRAYGIALLIGLWGLLHQFIIRPLVEEIGFCLRWLVTRERGWLRRNRPG